MQKGVPRSAARQMAQASSNPGSTDQQNVNIQKSQVAAIMSYSLMARSDADENKANNHCNVEHQLPGTESPLSLRQQVHFPADLRLIFAQQERYQRELLGQAFLLSLAFTRLVLLQDAQSIARVTRNAKSSASSETACGASASQ